MNSILRFLSGAAIVGFALTAMAQTSRYTQVPDDVLVYCDPFEKTLSLCLKKVEPPTRYGYPPIDANLVLLEDLVIPAGENFMYFQDGKMTVDRKQYDSQKSHCMLGFSPSSEDRISKAGRLLNYAWQGSGLGVLMPQNYRSFQLRILNPGWNETVLLECAYSIDDPVVSDRGPSVSFLKRHLGSHRIRIVRKVRP